MAESVIVAVITAITTVICQVIISHRTSSLTVYRIDQLEEKVQKHNNMVERMYVVEQRSKSNQHRIDDLEGRL